MLSVAYFKLYGAVGAKVLFMKRQQTFFALIIFVLIVAACGGDSGDDFVEPERPVILIGNGEATVGGQLLNICWPKGTGNVSCEPSFAADDPVDALTIERTDTLTINVSEAEPPDEFLIESRELGPGGEPLISLTVQGSEQIELVASELSDGRNILDITAFYYNLAESQAIVTNSFAVDVGTFVAEVTPEATEESEPTVTPTVEVSLEATATITPTVEPTEVEATETPTEEASPEATEPIEVATEEETEEPEPTETESSDATETSDDVPTPTQERPTRAATTAVATEDETEEVTPTVRPTNTPTMAATTALPTLTPSDIPTTVAPSPTIEVITPVPTETTVSIITPTASEDDVSAVVGTVPPITVRVGTRDYEPIGLEYCRRGTNNEQICIERAVDTGSTVNRMVRIGRGRAARLRIGNGIPETVTYEVINLRTREVLENSERDGDNIILFSVDQPAGNYILSVVIDWGDTVGTFYFQLQIQE